MAKREGVCIYIQREKYSGAEGILANGEGVFVRLAAYQTACDKAGFESAEEVYVVGVVVENTHPDFMGRLPWYCIHVNEIIGAEEFKSSRPPSIKEQNGEVVNGNGKTKGRLALGKAAGKMIDQMLEHLPGIDEQASLETVMESGLEMTDDRFPSALRVKKSSMEEDRRDHARAVLASILSKEEIMEAILSRVDHEDGCDDEGNSDENSPYEE